jgi:hypothetical protein
LQIEAFGPPKNLAPFAARYEAIVAHAEQVASPVFLPNAANGVLQLNITRFSEGA